jgi:uncharacterized protein (TIGR00255 family)
MIKSMTGFGTTDLVIGAYHHRLDIRTVNSKFCDVKTKIPPDLNWLDIRIQQYVQKVFARGHIEVLLFRDSVDASQPNSLSVNWNLAEAYYKTYQSIKHKFGISHDVNLSMVTNARDVISISAGEVDPEITWRKVEAALEKIIVSVNEMRNTEGRALAMDLAGRCNTIKEFLNSIGKLAPTIVETYRQKLEEKIAKLAPQEIDDSRLAQEVCYFSDRCDITEEITRLRSHIQQFLFYLDSEEPVGRKLDFLVQEMNRETNTIGSKSNSAEISQQVVEVKSELEKIREQIQNVE